MNAKQKLALINDTLDVSNAIATELARLDDVLKLIEATSLIPNKNNRPDKLLGSSSGGRSSKYNDYRIAMAEYLLPWIDLTKYTFLQTDAFNAIADYCEQKLSLY